MCDIHKNAETFGETTVVQIINKKVEEGKVVAMAISDGHYVSPDVLILCYRWYGVFFFGQVTGRKRN